MLKKAMAAVAAMTALAGAADAREWPTTRGWRITQGDAFCLMTNEYRGRGSSMLMLALNDRGPPVLADLNGHWSAEEGKTYENVSLVLNGRRYSGGPAVGMEMDGRRGIAFGMPEASLKDFAASYSLHLYRDGRRIDGLSLYGSRRALEMANRCLAEIRMEAAARRIADDDGKDIHGDLPEDPFAK